MISRIFILILIRKRLNSFMSSISRIIGVDPGLIITGFGILDHKNNITRLVAHGAIKPPPKINISDRLEYLNSHMLQVLEKFEPQKMAIESIFHNKNFKSALTLGQAQAAIILAAASKGIDCVEYAPRKIKKSVVGNGNADKKQVQYMVKTILKLELPLSPLDISDAVAVALCHLNQNKYL